MPGNEIETALEVFARAFAQVRSRAYPVVPELREGVWILADSPHRTKARAAELITQIPDPFLTLRIGNAIPAKRWTVALAIPADVQTEPIVRSYKAAEFRRFSTEPFFTLDPGSANLSGQHKIVRVDSAELARLIQTKSKGKHIEPQHIGNQNAPNRQYACLKNGEPIGWVSSLRIENLGTWVSNLFVHHAHRGQGVGASLMSALLIDNPGSLSVLAASSDGARLYTKLGYAKVADLVLFRPPNYGC